MFLPIATSTSIRRTPWVNYGLIAVNVVIFVLPRLVGGSPAGPTEIGRRLVRWHDLGVLDGAQPQLYQFFTYQFLHANYAHIGGNMLFLWVFGNPVNAKMRNGPYLFFYLACGVFSATAYAFTNDHSMVGASGAIAGITTAYLAMFPRSYITILYWWFFIGTFELPSMIMIVFKMILWDNVLAPQMVGAGNVAFGAHLAGYAFGFAASFGMLALGLLPRDQFDIVALWRRWFQRQAMKSAMADPDSRARAQYGRVARPVLLNEVIARPARDARQDQVTELRVRISEAFARNDWPAAAELYEKILDLDPRHLLPQRQQLDVANQLCALHRFPQAAAAYERYLAHYSASPEASEVELLLGIIYARDLQQYEVAEAHLRRSLERVTDEKRKERCRHWLEVAARALGRPAPEP